MFKITYFLQSSDHETQVGVSGQTLIVDGQHIDFSELGEGEQCETTLPLIGVAKRINGVIEVGVILQYSTQTAEPLQSTNQDDYVVLVSDGPAPDVLRRKPIVQTPTMETAEDAQA